MTYLPPAVRTGPIITFERVRSAKRSQCHWCPHETYETVVSRPGGRQLHVCNDCWGPMTVAVRK